MKRLILVIVILATGFSFSTSYGSETFIPEKEVQKDTIIVGSQDNLRMVITNEGTIRNVEVSKEPLQEEERVLYYLTWILVIIGLIVVVYVVVIIIKSRYDEYPSGPFGR